MKWFDDYRMRFMLVVFVATVVLSGQSAQADFTFGEPTNLGPTVNSSASERALSVSADGLELFFTSGWPGGVGASDIWVTTRVTTDDEWGTPMNLGTTVNSSSLDGSPNISADGLTLFFHSDRSGGSGAHDLWMTTRATISDPWGSPVNLGPMVNSSYRDSAPGISADGLTLYFSSTRPGGYGDRDLYVTTRATTDDPWGPPMNLGATVNCWELEDRPSISSDGLALFFMSNRLGGYGGADLWVTTRATVTDTWGTPVNLGTTVNSSAAENSPEISADGSTLFFISDRPSGVGGTDLWQAPVIPIVDFNSDGIVDAADMCIMVDYWGTDYSLCDIGPMPWGDGVVDVQDLIVLADYLFEEFPPVE